jgi:hypothetical protein
MTEPDGSGAQAPVVPTGAAMSKFDRFSAVVMAALVGLVAVVAALYVFAARLRLGGGGILYVVLFLAVGGGSYILCAKLVRKIPWTRWLALAGLVIAVGYVAINYRALGAKDPFLPAVIVLLPVALLYMLLPNKR